jgi:hypothetical protein
MVREQQDSLPRDGQNGPRCRRGATALVFLAVLFYASAIAAQSTLYVDGSAAGADDGSNWCDAFVDLQDALAAARASGGQVTEIRVGGGAYRPDRGGGTSLGDRTAAFELIDGVALRGGYAGCSAPDPDARDIKVHVTTLTGDLLGDDVASEFPGGPSFGDNSYHVEDRNYKRDFRHVREVSLLLNRNSDPRRGDFNGAAVGASCDRYLGPMSGSAASLDARVARGTGSGVYAMPLWSGGV